MKVVQIIFNYTVSNLDYCGINKLISNSDSKATTIFATIEKGQKIDCDKLSIINNLTL